MLDETDGQQPENGSCEQETQREAVAPAKGKKLRAPRRRTLVVALLAVALVLVVAFRPGIIGLNEWRPLVTSSSPASSPSSSTGKVADPASRITGFPADILAYVTVAEMVAYTDTDSKQRVEVEAPEGMEWWILDVTVRNYEYSMPVTSTWDAFPVEPEDEQAFLWALIIDDEYWVGRDELETVSLDPMAVQNGHEGRTVLLFVAPDVHPCVAELCYLGQEPYSYAGLYLVQNTDVFDWDTKEPASAASGPMEVPVTSINEVTTKTVDGWQITLDGARWDGTTVYADLTIVNFGSRRCFGSGTKPFALNSPDLVAVDSTDKEVDPWVSSPTAEDYRAGILFFLPPYSREFYPQETWSGTIRFDLSSYSGQTILAVRFNVFRRVDLFSLGSPSIR